MSFDPSSYSGATYDNPTGGFLNAKEIKSTWAEMSQSGLMRNAQILSVIPLQSVIGNVPTIKIYQYQNGKKKGQYYMRWRFDVCEPSKNRWSSFSLFIDCLNAGGEIDRNSQNWQALRNDLGILCNVDINNSVDLDQIVVPTNTGGFIKYAGLEGLHLDFMIEVRGVYNGHADANLIQMFSGEKSTREKWTLMQGQTLNQSMSDAALAWSRVRCKTPFNLCGGLPGSSVPPVPASAPKMPQMPPSPWSAPQSAPTPAQTAAPSASAAANDADIPF